MSNDIKLPPTDWYSAWSGSCLYGVYDNETGAQDEARRIGTNAHHSGLYTADQLRAAVLADREGRSDGRLRIHITALVALVQGMANAADIDLDDVTIRVNANDRELASKTATAIVDSAMQAADAQRAKETK